MGERMLVVIYVLAVLVTAAYAETGGNKRELGKLRKTIRGLSSIDTNYIEPQHYNYTVMLQTTYNYELYQLKSSTGQEVTFSPDVKMRVGPYIGWRWFFLGYTFDLKNISFSSDKQRRELDFSIYSSKIGIDLFYRRTGSDYKIRDAFMGDDVDVSRLDGVPFDGISVGITGANVYYIFNHRRFSYPAAFSQSTCQKLSCGSWIAGIGYTRNSLELDYNKLQTVVSEHSEPGTVKLDSGLMFNSIKYYDVNFSCGYAYNWVFAKNWLACASGAVAVAYKHSSGDTEDGDDKDHGFRFDNVNFDGIGRFGLVYNNTRWYAGMSAIVHAYTYRKSRFMANNVFGSINIYIGYNFGKKERYRNKR